MKLPFRPWWWKPNYVGRHRGTYQFWSRNAALPYGVKEIKITPYVDANGTELSQTKRIRLGVNMIQFKELQGD